MAPELEKYFNNYHSLFRNEGWTQLVEELKNTAVHTNDVQNTKDSEDLYFRKGQLAVIANLLNLEATVNASYEQAVEEDKDAQSV